MGAHTSHVKCSGQQRCLDLLRYRSAGELCAGMLTETRCADARVVALELAAGNLIVGRGSEGAIHGMTTSATGRGLSVIGRHDGIMS
jgi:hypothetical protein